MVSSWNQMPAFMRDNCPFHNGTLLPPVSRASLGCYSSSMHLFQKETEMPKSSLLIIRPRATRLVSLLCKHKAERVSANVSSHTVLQLTGPGLAGWIVTCCALSLGIGSLLPVSPRVQTQIIRLGYKYPYPALMPALGCSLCKAIVTSSSLPACLQA